MSFNKIIFCQCGKDNKWYPLGKYLFYDIQNDNRVIYLEGRFKESSCFLINLLRRIHFSRKINQIINLPLKDIWKSSLETVPWEDECSYVVIFLEEPNPIPIEKLMKIKRTHQVKYSLLLLNPFTNERQLKLKPYFDQALFDYIFTFDNADAVKYQFIYTDTFYSILQKIADYSNEKKKYDIYYVGGNKGRLNDLLSLYSAMQCENISSIYRITDVEYSDQQWKDKIIYNDFIDYGESVKELKSCNCILELIASDQFGATLRYYEAVCYNKKLLTNNKNVVNLPFYNPDYIHVFEKPEDIDWNWVKERIPVDYHYDGRFSPTHLIDKIIELEEEKERNELGKVEAD